MRWLSLVALLPACSPVLLSPGDPGPLDADERSARAWLEQSGALDGVDEVVVVGAEIDPIGLVHVRFQQLDHGVPVVGGQVLVHVRDGLVRSRTDTLRRWLDVDPSPAVARRTADDTALGSRRGRVSATELQIVHHDGAPHLAWRVAIDRQQEQVPSMPVVYVDAETGRELFRFDNLQTARVRNTHDADEGTTLPGELVRTEDGDETNDGAIDDAHDHAGLSYDWYLQEQGRDSFDGAGAPIVSTAHFGEDFDNAFWNGTQMVYGDGDVLFDALSGALDVVGHELTHAVTDRTSGLIYSGESGGLNEASSDILGAAIESWSRGGEVDEDTWRVGEDIARSALGDALRFMDDPPADGRSIDHYGDFVPEMDVHFSSGIANKMFTTLVDDHGVPIDQAADIWFRALVFYMTPSTTFSQARDATAQAATDLFGAGAPQVLALAAAWDGVGVFSALPDAPVPPAPPDTPTVCGFLPSGGGLGSGAALPSCDGRFQLSMQTDGNLVLYHGPEALFATGTHGNPGASVVLQTDGNLVVYGTAGDALWASGTAGTEAFVLAVQDDGNLVLYGLGPVWSSGTCCR